MPIKYDEYIKQPNQEIEYNEEMINEIIKCKNDYLHFIKNYVHISTTDHGVRLFNEPYPFQEDLWDKFHNNRFCCAMVARQSGKCICSDSKIKIRNKKTGVIEEIKIKDFFDKIKG